MFKYDKRSSPSVSAQDFPNQIKIGNDKEEYVSKSDKNKVFRWYKIKDGSKCKSAQEYYMQLPKYYLDKKFIKYDIKPFEIIMKLIKKELEKKNIFFIKIGWKNVYDFIDNAWEDALYYIKNKLYKDDKKIKTIYEIIDLANFIFYTDNIEFWAKHNGNLPIQWNLDKNAKKETFEIFKKYFKRKFIQPKSIKKTILIKLPKL